MYCAVTHCLPVTIDPREKGEPPMKTVQGKRIDVTTRGHDTIRIGVRDHDGRRETFAIFTVAEIEALERELKAKRDKIRRKLAKKTTR